MKYLVVECHPAYAVVTDRNGRFIKTANLHYNVGDIVEDVIEIKVEQKRKCNCAWIYAVVAACLLLVMLPTLILPNMMYASVYMKINPEVRIDVNRKDVVVGLEGVNDDGIELIKGYSFKNKDVDTVVDELVIRAIDMEYLKEGGTVAISLDGKSEEWVNNTGGKIDKKLSMEGAHKTTFNVEVKNKKNNQHVHQYNFNHRDENDDKVENKHEYDDDGDCSEFDESSRFEPPYDSDKPFDPDASFGSESPQGPQNQHGNGNPDASDGGFGNGLGKPDDKNCKDPDRDDFDDEDDDDDFDDFDDDGFDEDNRESCPEWPNRPEDEQPIYRPKPGAELPPQPPCEPNKKS